MELNRYIDYTLLKPETTTSQIIELCNQAIKYNFYSVCVNSYWVKLVTQQLLTYPKIHVCAVVGFPLGACSSETKVFEAQKAIENGADEIDMVFNIGLFIDNQFELVYQEICKVQEVIKNKKLKVIIETCLLTDEQKIKAAQIIVKAKAAFVKTSTGFNSGGATIKDIMLLKQTIGDSCLVKASGGIKNFQDAEALIVAGASRLGTSGGIEIVNNKTNTNY